MTDDDRISLAKPGNTYMVRGVEHTIFYGPIERTRCAKHPRMTETYRWSWAVPTSEIGDLEAHKEALESSDADYARSCRKCAKELEDCYASND